MAQEMARQEKSFLMMQSEHSTAPQVKLNAEQRNRIMNNFKDKGSKQIFERTLSQGNHQLACTAETAHPALFFASRKNLWCKRVCQTRSLATAEAYGFVDSKVSYDVAEKTQSENGNRTEVTFAQVLEQVMTSNPELSQGANEEMSDELSLLMNFVPLDKNGNIASKGNKFKSELDLVLTLWVLLQRNRRAWAARLALPLNRDNLLEIMMSLNEGEPVQAEEAMWVQEKFHTIPCEVRVEETKLLLCLAYWYSTPQARPLGGLNREQLLQRIELEGKLWVGMRYFVLWLTVSCLFARALWVSNDLAQCHGIKGNMETQLELHQKDQVTSLAQIHDFAETFAGNLATFVPLSEAYFGGSHAWTLQDATRAFSAPVPLPFLMLPDPNNYDIPDSELYIGKAFTLQAWVKLQENTPIPDIGLSLMRKSLPGSEVGGMSLSCWRWHFPPALSFGAHDFGSRRPANGRNEEFIEVDYPPGGAKADLEETHRSVLHTLLVNQTTVTFMVDREEIATVPLPRPVTDCTSNEITIGDKGLTLASMRFFPRRLSATEVRQIFSAGSTWKDIGRMVSPQKMMAMTQVRTLHSDFVDKVASAEEATKFTQETALTASVMTSQLSAPSQPYINRNHPIPQYPADDVLGYPYWEIHKSPVFTDERSRNLAEGIAIPQPAGSKGFTVSSWLKFSDEGSGYLMALAMPLFSAADIAAGNLENPIWSGWENMCWALWVGGGYTGFYTKSGVAGSAKDGPRYHVKDSAVPEEWKFPGRAYHHFVISMDPSNQARPFRVCIDNHCTGEANIDTHAQLLDMSTFPPAASCAQTGLAKSYSPEFREGMLNMTKLFLNRRQPDVWHYTGWQMQTKFFDRQLTRAEVTRLFEGEKDPTKPHLTIRQTVGCKLTKEVTDDAEFVDGFGRDCQWYFRMSRSQPAVCNSDVVKQHCAMACIDHCFGSEGIHGSESSTFRIWNQQLDFRTRGRYGTMCVAKSTTPEKEAISCALNAPNFQTCQTRRDNGENIECGPKDCTRFLSDSRYLDPAQRTGAFRDELRQCLGNTRWVPESGDAELYIPCHAIIDLNMPECAWDDTGLDAFVAKISDSWSMSFWYESLSRAKCAEPRVRFLDGQGATVVSLGPMGNNRHDYQRGGRWISECNGGTALALGHRATQAKGFEIGDGSGSTSAQVVLPSHDYGKKHFVALGRHGGSLSLKVDERSNKQVRTDVDPITKSRDFLRVINVGGDIRLSPMELRPVQMSDGELEAIRLDQRPQQEQQVGASQPLQEQFSGNVSREVSGASQKTMLVAPPLILLKRNAPGSCSDSWFVQRVYEHSHEIQCQDPYTCIGYQPELIYTCPAEKEADSKHFGFHPVEVGNGKFYVEFLASITDNAVIVREEGAGPAVMKTSEFVDILTKEAQIRAVFYSLEFGIMSVLRISFDASAGRVYMRTTIKHSVAASDDVKLECIIEFVVSLLCLVLIIWDMVRMAMKDIRNNPEEGSFFTQLAKLCATNLVLAAFTAVLIVLQMIQVITTPSVMAEQLQKLLDFDWEGGAAVTTSSGGDVGLMELKKDFIGLVDNVESTLFGPKSVLDDLSICLSMLLLWRLVYATSAHPRMGLITRTMELAASDLMHFFLLMFIVFMGFALLGTWMFGDTRAEFRTPFVVFATLFDAFLGPPGMVPILDSRNSLVEVAYMSIFYFFCYLFLLNFVLAVVVDSYTRVMAEIQECIVDQNIFADVAGVFRYWFVQIRFGFPRRGPIKRYLSDMSVKFVTMEDLYGKIENQGEEIFKSQQAAQAFFDFYGRYSFLTDMEEDVSKPSISDWGMIQCLNLHRIDMIHLDILRRLPAKGQERRHRDDDMLPVSNPCSSTSLSGGMAEFMGSLYHGWRDRWQEKKPAGKQS